MKEKREHAGGSSALQIDMLKGPIFKTLAFFALPVLFSNLFQQFYNTMDTMIVGNYLGDTSLAAIGVCTPIYDLLVGFALGIGNGLAIVTARSFGAGEEEDLKRSVAGSIVIGIMVSLAITGIAQCSLRSLLKILDTPPEIVEEAYSYIATITLYVIVMFAYNLCEGLLRAIGNSVMPLVFLILSSCLNIVLDIFFITRLDMGVRGAAVATVIAQGISVLLCFVYIVSKSPILVPQKRHFAAGKKMYLELLGQGFSMGFMNSIVSAGSVILQYGINGLGSLIIAGHTTARKLYMFCIMPIIAMAMAFSTFVSQNKGADQGVRIRKAARYVYLYSLLITVVIMGLTWVLAPTLVKWVSGSREAVLLDNAARYLKVVSPFYAVLGVLCATRSALQGLGQKLLPLVSSIIEFFGKILFVLLFIPRFGYIAVILCEPVIWCVMTVQLVYTFYADPYIRSFKGKG